MTPTAPSIAPIDPATFRRTPWKNGGGVTLDIAGLYRPGAEPGTWTGVLWRLGRTSIIEPGPFSDLSGYERLQTVITGRGLVLRLADGRAIDLREPFTTVRYDGGWPLRTELEAGPVEVVNLIGDPEAVSMDMTALRAGGSLSAPAGTAILYAPGEAAALRVGGQAVALAPGGAARIEAGEAVDILADNGLALVATISARSR